MKKRVLGIVSALLALCMMLVMSSVGIYADSEAWDGESYDTSWYNTTDTSFTINTPAQLRAFALIVNGSEPDGIAKNNFRGITITLGADIDLGDKAWTPISDQAANTFNGTFDGAGHTISGLNVNMNNWGGLFGAIRGASDSECAVIRNLTLKGSVTVLVTTGTSKQIGGLCAQVTYGEIENCTVDVSVNVTCNDKKNGYSGGIVGKGSSYLKMTNCVNLGNVNGCKYVGGLVAFTHDTQAQCRLVVNNCANLGNISGQSYVGGLVGNFAGSGNGASNMQSELINCYNTGNITAIEDYAGGLSATLAAKNNVKNCFTTGTVTGGEGASSIGAVFGDSANPATFATIEYVSDVYYLTGACGQAIGSGEALELTSMSVAEIASADFVTTLNTNAVSLGSTEDIFKAGQDHPIFVWQAGEAPAVEAGDIDCNGRVDEQDLTLLVGHVIGTDPLDPSVLSLGDLNGNSFVDENDVTYLIQKVLIH